MKVKKLFLKSKWFIGIIVRRVKNVSFTFKGISAICLTLISAFFLIKGTLFLSSKEIYMISGAPFGGENKEFAISLLQQQLDTRIGFSSLLLSFILQMFNLPLAGQQVRGYRKKQIYGTVIFWAIICLLLLGYSIIFKVNVGKNINTIVVNMR